MAFAYSTTLKNSRMDAITTAAGTTAVLEITDSGSGILVSFALNNPIAAASAAGVLTLSGFPKTSAASATGTANLGRIRTATGGTDVVSGLTVALTAANIILDSLSITSAQNVTISASPTITHG